MLANYVPVCFIYETNHSFKLLEHGSESSNMCEKDSEAYVLGLNAVAAGS